MAASASASASASALTATSSSVPEEELTLTVKWSGKEYTVRVCGDDSVGELKRRICELTTVLPKRQKLLYPKLIASRLADDSVLLSQLPLKSSLKMTMIGYLHFTTLISYLNTKMTKKAFLFWWKFVIEIRKVVVFILFYFF